MIGRLRSALAHSPAGRAVHGLLRDVPERWREGTTRVGAAPRRLLIAPVNSAGQGYAWARAAETIPAVAAANYAYRDPGDVFGFPADHRTPTGVFVRNRTWQRAQRRAVLRRFTHVVIESGRPILGPSPGTVEQVGMLREAGVEVALLFHGSDIRMPSRHAEREPRSPFIDARYPETDRLEEIATRNHALIAATAAPVFVSTLDLLDDVPHATWLPVVIDVDAWRDAGAAPPLERERPIVVHAPSNAGLKGSELIADTMRRLHEEGLVDYREVRGVPAADMPGVYGGADIVLDQFSLGIYGVAAAEAMAAGRLVISHVGDTTRRNAHERTGRRLPILEARADDLEAVLRRAVAARAEHAALAAEGPSYAAAVHDGAMAADALRGFLGGASQGARRPGMGQ
ncbi:hypothetical protein [Microbacterium hominis]|uniref:Glycosyltransferase n=1 Tax=Microbacterium hominis TaxID=162426 RepID=A0A7D4U8H6_9MICO|nr:hypothetical protein [Microbacterium hominis]QKJ20026.1 hypothetical protein HQM25_12115 [Microbacterium hominis]